MGLSNELITQFVKVTNDKPEAKKETTVYGTTVRQDGITYVKLDGSELLTPVTSTVATQEGERVTVTIKNHTAMITGNISSPSASDDDVQSAVDDSNVKITEFEIALGDKASVEALNAESARIDELAADNVTIHKSLDATNVEVDFLQADTVEIANQLTAATAAIEEIQTTKLSAEIAEATYATIESLNSRNAEINVLETELASIDELIFGSASGNTIQTSFSNAVIAQLGDAQIKSAMIQDISADKITAGDIITNNVRVKSEDGSLLISDETMHISDGTRVRVQIGKDASEDYSINIWDADGNLMFSEGGITDSAIKEAIIRNDMVSDTANISAHKLDIDSLFEEINGSSNTIKSTKVYFDDQAQTLDVAFESLETDISNLDTTVTSQGTDISAIQGQITSKIWQQDIDTAKDEMSTQYSSLEQALNGFQTTVGETYATKTDVSDISIGGRNLFEKSGKLTTSFMGNYSCPEGTYSSGEDPTVPSGQYIALTFTTDPAVEYEGGPYLSSYYTGYIPKMIAGETYTVSVWTKCTTAKNTGVCRVEFLKDVTSKSVPVLSTEWQRYVITGTYNGNTTSSTAITFYYGSEWVDGDVFYISSPKIEKGNVATDWTPAPEDFENTVSDLDSRVTTNASSIAQLSTSITSRVSEVEVAVQTVQETADNIQIGGRNLARNTGLSSGTANLGWYQSTATAHTDEIVDEAEAKSGKARKITYEESGCYGPYWTTLNSSMVGKYFTVGDAYTQSVMMKASSPFTIRWGHEGLSHQRVTLTETWEKYTFTTTAYDSGTMERGISFYPYPLTDGVPAGTVLYIADYKMEIGNRATDWTPAPEDMATADSLEVTKDRIDIVDEKVSVTTSLIEQLSDSISMLVTDVNGASLMTQTEDGWMFSTAEIQNTVNGLSESLNSLTSDVGDMDNTVSILQQAVDDLGTIAEYVSIKTYEDEPCIELGEGDSEFKLRITNTRMVFTEGSTVLAYFNNQSFHSKKVVIEEELQQGGFVWKVRPNGNLGLVWKGGNN